MSNILEYKELLAFHPGYYLAEIIDELGISHAEFAQRLGTTPKTVSLLVNGQANLSNALAGKLALMLGTSVDLWLGLQQEFDRRRIEIETARALDRQADLAVGLDYAFFVRVAGLPETDDVRERIRALCRYLAVSDLSVLAEPDFLVDFRAEVAEFSGRNRVASRAWLQTAINLSRGRTATSFNAARLQERLPEIRRLTDGAPADCLPELTALLAGCGVVFVLLPPLAEAGVSGAVRWVSPNRAVLALSDAFPDAATFRLALFHELGHVLQQKVRTTFVSGLGMANGVDAEAEAERFALTLPSRNNTNSRCPS